MKLGIINDWNEKGFIYAKNKGLDFLEFCVNCNYNVPEFVSHTEEIKGYIEKYGVTVGSVGRWGQDRLLKDGSIDENEMANSKLLVDFCAAVGCPVFVMGCNMPETDYFTACSCAIRLFREVVAYGREKGIKIAVYNCDWNNFVYNKKAWDMILPEVEGLGIKYDTSHSRGRGSDYIVEMLEYGQYFYHVHIKGSLFINGMHYDDPPAGLDQVNWGEFFDMLYTKGYKGGISLEPHSGYWHGSLGQWGVDFSIKYIRQFLMPDDYCDGSSPYMP